MQSRLDYFLISIQLSYNISNCTIKPGLKCDHSLINITLDLINTQCRRNSYWKFNNALLFGNTYTQLIKEEITSVAVNAHCTVTITYSISQAKRKEREKVLLQKLQILRNCG